MSDKTPASSKTEKPTARRLREAKRRGSVARSPEMATAASLMTSVVALRVLAPGAARTVAAETRALFAEAGTIEPLAALGRAGGMILSALPFAALALVLGVVASVAQTGLILAGEAAKPKLSHLSPRRGLERLKPGPATWDLVRTILKLGLLAAVVWGPVADAVGRTAVGGDLGDVLSELLSTLDAVLLRAALVAALVAAADYGIARHRHRRSLMMTRQEVRQEMKDEEGDPLARGRRRRRALELTRNRIINVAAADVVVTNPTHYAVALVYRPPESAPRVVAKGTNGKAAEIRRMAHRHGVPVIENRPLAQALFRRVRVGRHIPAALYEAAAVVLAEAYRRRPRRVA